MHIAPILSISLSIALFCTGAASAQHIIEDRPWQGSLVDSRVSLDQAVEMAQQRYRARAVRAETVQQGDRRVHRIRLLSADGKVWNVHVDAQTGAMD